MTLRLNIIIIDNNIIDTTLYKYYRNQNTHVAYTENKCDKIFE